MKRRVYFIEVTASAGNGVGGASGFWTGGGGCLRRRQGFEWTELLAGKKAFAEKGSYLPRRRSTPSRGGPGHERAPRDAGGQGFSAA
jgi:hypothetical protein